VVEHLGQLDLLHARENMIPLGPPGTGQGSLLAIALSIRACLASQRVQFATATQWVARLSDAKRQGTLETELRRLSIIPLIVMDLCRYRDYADTVAVAGVNLLLGLGFSSVSPASLSA
jgi:DNA replication protein DnaC